MIEKTLEITNYCPFKCKFCSTDITNNLNDAKYMSFTDVVREVEGKGYDRIIISGGEPMYHAQIGMILTICKVNAPDVMLLTNMITHIGYNPHVIDGIYVEGKLSVHPHTDKISILKRTNQGKEAKRPEVSFSRNWTGECLSCIHNTYKADGSQAGPPCKKNLKEAI